MLLKLIFLCYNGLNAATAPLGVELRSHAPFELERKTRSKEKMKTFETRRRWLSLAARRRRQRSRRQRRPNQAHEEKSRPSRRSFAATLLQLFTVSRHFLHERSIIKCETKTEEERPSEFVRKCALESLQSYYFTHPTSLR